MSDTADGETTGEQAGPADDTQERDKCRLVTEVALEQAAEKCAGDEAMKEQLRMMLGITGEEDDPDCASVRADGVTESVAGDPRRMNEWVFCRAWRLYETDDAGNLGEALDMAWGEARAKTANIGTEE
jgi:hypothetical protein